MEVLQLEINEAEQDLKDAKENLRRVKESYKNEPNLLNFYVPSAEYLVSEYENILNGLNDQIVAE